LHFIFYHKITTVFRLYVHLSPKHFRRFCSHLVADHLALLFEGTLENKSSQSISRTKLTSKSSNSEIKAMIIHSAIAPTELAVFFQNHPILTYSNILIKRIPSIPTVESVGSNIFRTRTGSITILWIRTRSTRRALCVVRVPRRLSFSPFYWYSITLVNPGHQSYHQTLIIGSLIFKK